MAVDIFLRIDGITGGSTDDRHRGEMEVLEFSWGASQTLPATGGGAGRPSFAELVVSCRMSQASPELWSACVSARRLSSAVLSCRQSGPEPHEFFHLELGEVIITSYRSDGSDGDFPVDHVSLAYGTIESTYTGVDRTGKPLPPVTGGWDVKKNVKA